MKIPPRIFFACKHFGTGVLVATAFVHVRGLAARRAGFATDGLQLLPTAFGNLMDPCLPDLFTVYYPPMPGVIMMASMFCLFVIEMWLNAKTGGHSHGGPMGLDSTPALEHHNHGSAPAYSHQHHHQPPRPQRDMSRGSFETDEMDYEKKVAQKMCVALVSSGRGAAHVG